MTRLLVAIVAVATMLTMTIGASVARAAAPAVTLNIPLASGDTCKCLQNEPVLPISNSNGVTVSVTAAATGGLSIGSVALQTAPAGTDDWTTLPTPFKGTGPYTAQLSYSNFPNPTGGDITGDYQVRAIATDSAGDTGESAATAVVLVDDFAGDTYVGLQSLGTAVSGAVNLVAAPWGGNLNASGMPDTVTFEIAPSGSGDYTPIATVPADVGPTGKAVTTGPPFNLPAYETSLDTTTLADGSYDLTVEAEDSNGTTYVGNVITVLVDNTPPTVTLADPGASLSGQVTLAATAQDSGSGVTAVRFEDSPSGSGQWSLIGLQPNPPYTQTFDTRGLANGVYDLRAVATDLAGNSAASTTITVTISNPVQPNPDSFTISDSVVPATDVSLLGTGPGGETWAYGYTNAPPPVVAGATLPYTAASGAEQLVLLRYTAGSGWEIADVLRNSDGSPYPITGTPGVDIQVSGQMAPSGEAWVVVEQEDVAGGPAQAALFHRSPGGQFLLDQGATTTMQPVLSGSPRAQVSVAQAADGSVYGILTNPGQVATTVRSGTTNVSAQLNYGLLANGAWTLETAPVPPGASSSATLQAASLSGPGTGWAVFTSKVGAPLLLGSFGSSGWQFAPTTGLDALDLTGSFASGFSIAQPTISVDSDGVWVGATVNPYGAGVGSVVALFDPATGRVVSSWCGASVIAHSVGCGSPLDANHPAAVPEAAFDTGSGTVAVALGSGFVDVYAHGAWTSVAAPGFSPAGAGSVPLTPLFTGPGSGWLPGENSMGQMTPTAQSPALASWPQANENTLLAAALPPAGAGVGTSGALAVGLDGAALHYDASAGWTVDPVPERARAINLLGVAYDGPSDAVAVGGFGTILDWNGSGWSEDPQSTSLTENQLNAVAFGSGGQGWAVGAFGTILHYDGTAWSQEAIDSDDAGTDVTSVAVAGSQVFAVAGGNLITRASDGTWQRVDLSSLSPALTDGSLTRVAALPDGGVVAAGDSVVIVRQSAASSFEYSSQPIDGDAVGLAAFRDPGSGQVRAFVSVAPPVTQQNQDGTVGGFPSGDGELMIETATGWSDLSQAQYPATTTPGDGAPEPDPVLAIAAASDGGSAWVVGGYAGTTTAAGLGSGEPLQATPSAWQTSSIWRYDAGGSATAPTLSQAQVSIPAEPDTVSFAFFSSALCYSECSAVENAQPDSNLNGAAAEISSFAAQPGGPAFALLGGNAVGPTTESSYLAGNGAVDFANLGGVLSPLGGVPLYAAYGPLDAVPSSTNPVEPWSQAFAEAPAPFGRGSAPAGITPVSSGATNGSVNLYYAFDAAQNGSTLRVIVLDNSAGSLELSAPGQTAWLDAQLAAAQSAGLPVVVFCSEPLDSTNSAPASDADAVAAKLANAGVLAVFTTAGGSSEQDSESMVPANAPPGAPQVPEYTGGSLGYQQTKNNGVLWYFVSIDTVAREVTVQGIPVIQSLALEPLSGLTVNQSSTLSFQGVGRRPPGTLATTPAVPVQGYANYVAIPSASCSGCIGPSYTFTSSNPAVGTFVQASGPGSQFPALSGSGKPIPSTSSGLFCAFNPGTTTVSVTSGLLTASQTVTVRATGAGAPCGTVPDVAADRVISLPGHTIVASSSSGVGTPNLAVKPQAGVQPVPAKLGKIVLPPKPPPVVVAPKPTPAPIVKPQQPAPKPVITHKVPVPAPRPQPQPQAQPQPQPVLAPPAAAVGVPPVVVPPIAPPITPVPPGGATVQAQSTAKREEKARKHASQSAYVTRPAGTSAEDWFYGAVGVMSLIAMWLVANGVRPGPKQKLALLKAYDTDDQPQTRWRAR